MKVLIAEDDTASRIILEKHLNRWGYHTLAAADGRQAWEMFCEYQPQIMLIDWVMPGINGLELCQKIRSSKNNSYTYIIFLTSRVESEDVVTALDAGADDYICKPLDRDVLKSRILAGARTINYEERLHKSRQRYQKITDSITDYIFTVKITDAQTADSADQKNVEFIHNDSSAAVTGYGPAEFAENKNLWFEMAHKSDLQSVLTQFDKCSLGKQVEPIEYRIIRKDGQIRWVKSTIVPHYSRQDELDFYDCLLQDITERKNAEEKMKEAKEKAEETQEKLEKLNLQLEITYKKLMETSHSAGMAEVASDVLHNVGNVLNSINVTAATMEEKLEKCETQNLVKLAELLTSHKDDLGDFLQNDPQGKHIPAYLSEVSSHLSQQQQETLGRLQDIIKNVRQVKDIVKMQQAYTGIGNQRDHVCLTELIENAIEINSAGLERHNIEVIREYDDIGGVFIDRQRFLHVMVNLIDNAENALTKADKESKILRIKVTKSGQSKMTVQISDNGIGIAPEDINSIFDKGYTTKRNSGGLGLHSCLAAARDMHGTLTVRSNGIGRGTEFILELPLRKAEVTK